MKGNDVCPIDLHIAYEYLPVQQQSNILHSIDSIYTGFLVLQSKRNAWPLFPLERYNYEFPYLGSPLCIYSAFTGESITIKFDIERKIFPSPTRGLLFFPFTAHFFLKPVSENLTIPGCWHNIPT